MNISLKKWIVSLVSIPLMIPFTAITGVLAAVLYPSTTWYFEGSRDINRVASLRNINLALSMYYVDNNQYPKSDWYCFDDIADTLSWVYLSTLPKDPKTWHGISGCESGFGYRSFAGKDGQVVWFALSAVMEIQKNANFNETQSLFKKTQYMQSFDDVQRWGNIQKDKKDWLYVVEQ